MTEAEWLASVNPAAMLGWLCDTHPRSGQPHAGRPSERKLLLFSLACRLASARGPIDSLEVDVGYRDIDQKETSRWNGERLAVSWGSSAGDSPGDMPLPWRADILRDIVGNPFRPVALPKGPARLCPRCEGDGWVPTPDGLYASRAACKVCNGKGTLNLFDPCPWINPTVQSLATAAYEHRTPQGHLDAARLAVLADALEEAGCDSEDVLRHLRHPGPHVRGCWVLDLLTGKG